MKTLEISDAQFDALVTILFDWNENAGERLEVLESLVGGSILLEHQQAMQQAPSLIDTVLAAIPAQQ